ncbi:MAG: insulinase family protein [Agarilytica sp.]
MQKTRHAVKSLINTSLVLLLFSWGQHVMAGKIKQVRSIEGITEYALDNGLQLLLFPDQGKETVTVNITYHVGSKHENYGETGMAHLLEHLLFKGSKNHPDVTKELTDHGAQANGTTWLERTNYYETIKATEENLSWALHMEADRMVNSFVAQKDLDSEMTVVRNEFERGENSPWRILYQRIYASAFDWHNYGNSTIGARSDIENVEIDNLKNFYKKYYQPDNATLIIAGKFDTDLALKLVNKTFGKIKRPQRKLPTFYTRDPVQDGERELVLRRAGGEQVVAAAYKIPPGTHKDFAALNVLASILGSAPSGRLHKSLVEKNIATTTWAWPNQQQDASLIYFNAAADINTDLDKTQQALIRTLEQISKNPITEKEVERAKRKLIKEMELSFNDSQAISIKLSEWIGIGDWRMLFINRDRLENVKITDVQRVANQYLISTNRTLGKFIPTDHPKRAEIPSAPDLNKLLAGYKGRAPIPQGEIFDTSLTNIASRQIKTQNAGLTIAAVPIKTRGESVFFELKMGIGNVDSLKNKAYIAKLTASMLSRGTTRFSREDLNDELDKLKAQGGFSSDAQSVSAQFETTRKNLPKVIDLVYEILTTANFPEKEFKLLKTQTLSQLNADLTDPQALAFNAIFKHLAPYPRGHVFHKADLESEITGIKDVSLTQVKSFHKSHYGSDNLNISIVGDFNMPLIKKQVEDKFADWHNKTPYERSIKDFQSVEQKERTLDTPDKKNAYFIAAKNIDMTYQDKDAPALYIATRIIGGGLLSSRLATRIRQKDGLSYSVRALLRLNKTDENGQWIAYAISAPQNTLKVQAAFKEEMQKVVNDGFTQSELDSAIDAFIDAAKVQRGDNSLLVKTIQDFAYNNFTFDDEIAFHTKIKNLSLNDVNKVAQKYLTPSTMSVVKAGDF